MVDGHFYQKRAIEKELEMPDILWFSVEEEILRLGEIAKCNTREGTPCKTKSFAMGRHRRQFLRESYKRQDGERGSGMFEKFCC